MPRFHPAFPDTCAQMPYTVVTQFAGAGELQNITRFNMQKGELADCACHERLARRVQSAGPSANIECRVQTGFGLQYSI